MLYCFLLRHFWLGPIGCIWSLVLSVARTQLYQWICLLIYCAHDMDYLLSILLLETLAAAGAACEIGAGQARRRLPDLLYAV